jgi:hypothetical protein
MENGSKNFGLRKTVLLALLFVGAIAAVATMLRRPADSGADAPQRNLTVLSLGVTNDAAGRAFAQFQLTNSTRGEVGIFVEAIDQLSSNEWDRTLLQGPSRSWINEWVGERKNILSPSGTYTFAAPAPVTNAAWRIVFRCVERQTVRDRSRELMIGFTNSSARNDRMFSGRSYHLITPEVAR